MPPLKSNKLIPFLAAVVGLIVVTLLWRASHDNSAVSAGDPLKDVPSTAKELGKKGGNWLVGRAVEDSKLPADADTPNETLKTLSAEVSDLRTEMRRVNDENAKLRVELRSDPNATTGQPRSDKSSAANDPLAVLSPSPATSVTSTPAATSSSDGGLLGRGKLGSVLADLGFGKADPASTVTPGARAIDPATMTSMQPDVSSTPTQPRTRTVLPMGYAMGKAANGADGIVKMTPAGLPAAPAGGSYNAAANVSSKAQSTNEMIDPATGEIVQGAQKAGSTKTKDKPYWTIPENATLMGATAMTAIVGRVPVDGRVQDPMQFKLLLGPTNLAANGHFLPPDLSGVVITGTAIGDMTLSCSEGVIQSLTFVFNDGSIRTVSTGASGGGQQSAAGGINNMSRLGFVSDIRGYPCITGKFVTNAPAFLTDVVGLKSLALAGKAAAAAQTTTSNSASTGTSSSSVTGSKGSYIFGQTVAGATDEVTEWLTRRMGNTFDAVVTAAGAEVVIHINKEIAIDKTENARKIDYGRIDSVADNSHRKGARHGLD